MTENILFIEDDPDLARLAKASLEGMGHRVSVVNGATDAVTTAQAVMPTVVIVDLSLPDGDGRAVIRALRSLEGLETTVVIICSGQQVEARLVRELLVDAVVPKPFRFQALNETISRCRAIRSSDL